MSYVKVNFLMPEAPRNVAKLHYGSATEFFNYSLIPLILDAQPSKRSYNVYKVYNV